MVHVVPLVVPVRPWPEASVRKTPVPSLKLYATERFVLSVAVKVAVTDFAAVMLTEQFPVPVQLPVQPPKVEPAVGVAVSVTTVPLRY